MGLYKFNPAEFLKSGADCGAYLNEFLNSKELPLFMSALGDVLKSKRKMTHAAKELGLSRAGLYKALSSDGNPSFPTVVGLLKVAGFRLELCPLAELPQSQIQDAGNQQVPPRE